jgi:hypothetical protein
MLMGLLAGIISALIAGSTMLALSDYQFFHTPHFGETPGTTLQSFSDDLPTALYMAFLWFVPIGVFVFPPVARLIGASSGTGVLRLLKFALLAAVIWLAVAEVIYLVLSPLAPAPPGVQRNDLISAALSGVLFAVIYDLLLRRRDFLLTRKAG